MSVPIPVGVIGGGRRASALAEHEAPLSGARVSRWSPSPCGRDRDGARALADRMGAAFSPEWEAVARDPSLPAVLVLSGDPERIVAVEAALSTGKVVLCPVPAVTRAEELGRLSAAETRGRGALVAPGELRHTPAGRSALRLLADGELGTLHSMYAAARFPQGGHGHPGSSVLEEGGWEIFDFLLAVTPAAVRRVHAHVSTLFGGASDDTAVLTLRFEDDMIATIELSRCLPPSVPTTVRGEVELEIVGSRQALRLEPWATALRVFGPDAALRPWVDDPLLAMLQEVVDAVTGGAARAGGAAQMQRAVALMAAVRAGGHDPVS